MKNLCKENLMNELFELNNVCKFNNEIESEYKFTIHCSSELEFNRFRNKAHARTIIGKDFFKWRLLIQIAEENNRIYNTYMKEATKIKVKYYDILDNDTFQEFKQNLLPKPITEPKIIITADYISPKTGKILTKKHELNYFEIKEILPYMTWPGEKIGANNYENTLKNYSITKSFESSGLEILDRLKPFEFEEWVAEFMRKCGYNAYVTNKSGDFGADVILEKDDRRIAIQCKLSKSILGIKCVQEIIAGVVYHHADEGWVFSTAPGFTPQACRLAESANIKMFMRTTLEAFLNSMLGYYKI